MQSWELPARSEESSDAPFSPPINKSGLSCGTRPKAERGRIVPVKSRRPRLRMRPLLRPRFEKRRASLCSCHRVLTRHPGFPRHGAIGVTLRAALQSASPARVVYLSTIGAQATQSNLLTQHTIIEETLGTLPMPITFLRPAWFMENCSWDVAPARAQGVIASFLNRSTGRCRWGNREHWQGGRQTASRTRDQSPGGGTRRAATRDAKRDCSRLCPALAAAGAHGIGAPRVVGGIVHGPGMKNPTPRMQMLDGFNEGWIDFERGIRGSEKGVVSLETVLKALTEREANAS